MRVLGIALVLAGCSMGRELPHNTPQTRTSLPERWHYDLELDRELTRIDVKLCFMGAVPEALQAGQDDAAVHLIDARWLSPGARHRLPVRDGRIELDGSARDACVLYRVRLEPTGDGERMVERVDGDVVASPNVWLWRPVLRAQGARASLRVTMPEGLRAVLPWQARDGVYALGPEAFRFDSYAAFGTLAPVRFSHHGIPIEAAIVGKGLSLSNQTLMHWLGSAVDTVSIAGHFPAQRLQVLAVPSGAGRGPVAFGMVARGGAGSVLLFVSEGAREEALVHDWVLPHELSHLWFPFIDRDHAWLSEGLATYLQELLRARSGVLTGQEALGGLAQGMRSARREGTGRDMRHESREMHETYAYRSVYWAGAAFFLMADVELRKRSAGAQSLETVLVKFREQNAYDRTWTADDVLRRLDELAGMSLFVPLSIACLAQPFPDVEPTLAALGLGEDGESLDDAAPLADVRRAMFAKRAPPAP